MGCLFQNYADFDRWEANVRGEPVGEPAVSDEDVWREQIGIYEMGEPLGFDTLWVWEHRTGPYIMSPSPVQLISYLTGRTSRIDFGTMVVVAPWHNPVRLAEELAVLQHMLGRSRQLALGLGRGLARREFDALGIPMGESRDRLQEVLEVLRAAFRNERFSYDGQFYKIPDSEIRPHPLDRTLIDNAYNAWGSPSSAMFAGEHGLNPLSASAKPHHLITAEMESYRESRAAHGWPEPKPPVLQHFMYCSESADQAEEAINNYFYQYGDSLVRHYELTGDHFAKVKGYEHYADQSDRSTGNTVMMHSGATLDELAKELGDFVKEIAVYGTPEQCIEKIDEINGLHAPSEVVMVCCYGSMRGEEAAKSVRLFADKVLPQAQKMSPAVKIGS